MVENKETTCNHQAVIFSKCQLDPLASLLNSQSLGHRKLGWSPMIYNDFPQSEISDFVATSIISAQAQNQHHPPR